MAFLKKILLLNLFFVFSLNISYCQIIFDVQDTIAITKKKIKNKGLSVPYSLILQDTNYYVLYDLIYNSRTFYCSSKRICKNFSPPKINSYILNEKNEIVSGFVSVFGFPVPDKLFYLRHRVLLTPDKNIYKDVILFFPFFLDTEKYKIFFTYGNEEYYRDFDKKLDEKYILAPDLHSDTLVLYIFDTQKEVRKFKRKHKFHKHYIFK